MTKIYPPFWIAAITAAIAILTAIGILISAAAKKRDASTTTDKRRRIDSSYRAKSRTLTGVSILGATLLIGAYVFFPFKMEYHQYTYTEGTLSADVGTRVITQGVDKNKTVDQVFAVQLEGKGIYRCDDTRCSLLHKGDRVALWCIREWQWAATPGYLCRFSSSSTPQQRSE